ncbi:MAG: hypothetical protein R3330_17615, partial [Saprospiraceae bacterium]|nr:hypothetical protein [Saprospiraceae bacterium]
MPLPPPAGDVDPTSVIAIVSAPGQMASDQVTLSNTAASGSQNLEYSITLTDTTPFSDDDEPDVNRRGNSESVRVSGYIESEPFQAPSSLESARLASSSDTPPVSSFSAADCTDGQQFDQLAVDFSTKVIAGGQELGQSFVAPCTGLLDNVVPVIQYSNAPNVTWQATMRVYEGAGTGGTVLGGLTFSYTNGASGVILLTIPMATPIEVTQGQTYTWFMDMEANSTGMHYATSDPLAGGTRYRTTDGNPASATATGQANNDMRFRLEFLAPTGPGWVSTPTPSGSVAPGGSDIIDLDFDATGLTAGTYTAEMSVATNEPGNSPLTVDITFIVGASSVTIDGGPGWRYMAPAVDGMTVHDLAIQNLVQ